MTLKSLFKKRNKLYYKKLLNYLRYIFNDHFSLVLFFLIGAGGYGYSNYLENLSKGNIQARLFLLIAFFFISIRTSVKLVVEDADQVFLLAKEEDFYSIFKQETLKSYFQSLIPIAFLIFITYPIFSVTTGGARVEGILLFLALVSLKWLNLVLKIYPYFYQNQMKYDKYRWFMQGLTFFVISSILFLKIKAIAILILLLALLTMYLFIKEEIYFNHLLKWDVMIAAEEARMNRIYRFIAVFVDVPQVDSGLKRLSFLDYPLEQLSKIYPKAPYYYSVRTVIRNKEYRSLILRLTIIASLFLSMTDSYLLSFVFTLFFIYILGFQLIALVQTIKDLPQFKINPVTEKDKIDSALYLINQILIFMGIVIGITTTVNLGWRGLSLFPVALLASYLFSYYYLPYRLKSKGISR